MPGTSRSVLIDAPPQRVFDVFADLAQAPSRISAIKKIEILTPGPVGVGTRFRETRVMFGKEASETMDITGFDPPRSYRTEARSCGTHYVSTMTFEPEGPATRVTMHFTGRPLTLTAKLLSFMLFFMMGACAKAITKDLEDLKRHIEGGGSPAGAPHPA